MNYLETIVGWREEKYKSAIIRWTWDGTAWVSDQRNDRYTREYIEDLYQVEVTPNPSLGHMFLILGHPGHYQGYSINEL